MKNVEAGKVNGLQEQYIFKKMFKTFAKFTFKVGIFFGDLF